MAKEYFQVNLPKSFLPYINHALGENLDSKVKLSLAISMLIEKQVTLAQASELAEMPLVDFIELLKLKEIPWVEYREEQFEDDLQTIQRLISDDQAST